MSRRARARGTTLSAQQDTPPKPFACVSQSVYRTHHTHSHTHAHSFSLALRPIPVARTRTRSRARSHSVCRTAGSGECAHTDVYRAPLLQFSAALCLSLSLCLCHSLCLRLSLSFGFSFCVCFGASLALLCPFPLSEAAATVYYLAAVVRRSQGFDLYLYFAGPL